jgi:hypothetical protein
MRQILGSDISILKLLDSDGKLFLAGQDQQFRCAGLGLCKMGLMKPCLGGLPNTVGDFQRLSLSYCLQTSSQTPAVSGCGNAS